MAPVASNPYAPRKKTTIEGKPLEKTGNVVSRQTDITKTGYIEPPSAHDETVKRWNQRNPEKKVAPQEPDGSYTVNGVELQMTPAQRTNYAQVSGARLKGQLNKIQFNIRNPGESDMDTYKKAVNDEHSYARNLLTNSNWWKHNGGFVRKE